MPLPGAHVRGFGTAALAKAAAAPKIARATGQDNEDGSVYVHVCFVDMRIRDATRMCR